mgnify:CR=1 FL=1
MVSESYPDGPESSSPIPPPASPPSLRRPTPAEIATLEDAVRRWHAAGVVVHPVRPDGSKNLVPIRGAGTSQIGRAHV